MRADEKMFPYVVDRCGSIVESHPQLVVGEPLGIRQSPFLTVVIINRSR